jgi:hypothetical protein
MPSLLYELADALAARLQTRTGGPPNGLSRDFAVEVDEIPVKTIAELRAKPLVTIAPRGHERAVLGRGAWTRAPELAVLIQFAFPDRDESSDAAIRAAEALDRRSLSLLSDEIEDAIAREILLDRPCRKLSQVNGAFWFEHLKNKRIFSRFLVATYTPQTL